MDLSQENRELILLEQIADDPDINQATLAESLNVAVGTVNWHIKRLVSKGYVKAKRAQRKKLRYIITPQGIALRARLTIQYIENQMRLYRETRQMVKELLAEARAEGFHQINVIGDSEIADVCQLTCLEQGFEVVNLDHIPVLEVLGYSVKLHLEKEPES
ncbi:MAG: winged helix-turn-helix transcriptional regulator [Anaerolineales bacterium]|nr:winged helix-turn-helix transcriptional regulator [Anaerolineales bacterium]